MRFELTCIACPEQYDVWDGDKQVAYVRLRHGCLTVDCPDVDGELVYEHVFDGNEWKGRFGSDEERKEFLARIEKIIRKWMKEQDAHS